MQRGLIEQTPVLGLRFIVPRRLPLDSTKHPPGGIRANLFLRHIDGQRSVWDIREKLACPPEEVIEHLTKDATSFWRAERVQNTEQGGEWSDAGCRSAHHVIRRTALGVLAMLYRERLIEIVQGEHEFRQLLDEY